MKNNQYIVNRENIYVGQVVRTSRIYRYQSYETSLNNKKEWLDTASWKNYRSMIFVLTKDKLANDLLYNTPNYPILNVTDDNFCLNLEGSNVVVRNSFNLSPILEYFEYNENLTFEDIVKIRKTFFDGKFAKENCELFGIKEIRPEDYKYYKNGKEVNNPLGLKTLILKEKLLSLFGEKNFVETKKNVLPKEYWNLLDKFGDNSLMEVVKGIKKTTNAFKPDKGEQKVKRLTRF